MKKSSYFVILYVIVLVLVLSSCGPIETLFMKKRATQTDKESIIHANVSSKIGDNNNENTIRDESFNDHFNNDNDKVTNNVDNNNGNNGNYIDSVTPPQDNLPNDNTMEEPNYSHSDIPNQSESIPKPNDSNVNKDNNDSNVSKTNEFIFNKLDNGYWQVCGINKCTDPNIILPSTHEGIEVVETCISAFQARNEFKTLTVPGSIKYIGTSSFQSCCNLTSVIFREGVERLGDSTFQCCDSLTTLVIPKSMIDLGSSSFSSCESLGHVFYGGNESEWQSKFNNYFYDKIIYYYSESQPSTSGNYWHYVGNTPTIW